MEREMYITNEERKKCRKVADAYAEFYELEDIFVADAGKQSYIFYHNPLYMSFLF